MRYILALLLMLCATVAHAQEIGGTARDWPSGPANETWTPPIDPDDPHPADTYEPAVDDENGYTRSLWTNSSGQRHLVDFSEDKFRTVCQPAFIKRADPLLAPGTYPWAMGHDHTFVGANSDYVIANVHNFDYSMGREHPGSSCQGGPLNSTLYWEPSVKDDRYGISLTVIPSVINFYYQTLAPGDGVNMTRLRRNYRFIGGANPMDYNDTARRAEYAAAGLEYPGSPDTPAGFQGIGCLVSAAPNTFVPVLAAHSMKSASGGETLIRARYLKGPNGEDPWDGACTAGEIIVEIRAQDCWDGNHLGASDGRDHVAYSTRDEDNAPGAGTCPTNYVKVPSFLSKVHFSHNGWTEDLQHWYLGSDRMNSADTPGDATSKDPCRQTGPYYCPLSTFHFDWWGSWDDEIFLTWHRNCLGMTVDGVGGLPADCGTSGIDGCYIAGGDPADGCDAEGGVSTPVTLLAGGTPPEAGLSTNPVNSAPVERASASTQGQRYFPVRPEDESQPALHVDTTTNHHGS